MQSKNALSNLKNRYRAVLKKCNLLNTFGSLALATLCISAIGFNPASANTIINPKGTTLTSPMEATPTDPTLTNNGTITINNESTAMQLNPVGGTAINAGTININSTGQVYGIAVFPETGITDKTFNINNSGDMNITSSDIDSFGISVAGNGTYNITSSGTMNITAKNYAYGIDVGTGTANITHTGIMNLSGTDIAEVHVTGGTANIQKYALDLKENHAPFVVNAGATLNFDNTTIIARADVNTKLGEPYEMLTFINNVDGSTTSGAITSVETVETLTATLGGVPNDVLNQTITLTQNVKAINNVVTLQLMQLTEIQLNSNLRLDNNNAHGVMADFLAPTIASFETGEEIGEEIDLESLQAEFEKADSPEGEATTLDDVLQKLRNKDTLSENEKKLLVGADLRGKDLSGMNFSGVDLTGVKFNSAIVTGANFKGAYVHIDGETYTFYELDYSRHLIFKNEDGAEFRSVAGLTDKEFTGGVLDLDLPLPSTSTSTSQGTSTSTSQGTSTSTSSSSDQVVNITISGSGTGSPYEDSAMANANPSQWSVHVSPYGSHSSRHDSNGHSNNFGIAGGISKQINESLSLGAHFDLGYTDSHSTSLDTNSDIFSASFGINGTYNITPAWYVSASLTGTINQTDSDYSSSIFKASNSNSGSAFSASLSTGYMWKINDNNVLAPQIGLNYIYTYTSDYDIKWNNGGSFYNIYNDAVNYSALYGTIGLRWLGIYELNEFSKLSPFVSVGIQQNLTGNPIKSTTTTFGTRYSAETTPNRTTVNASVGLTYDYKNFSLKLDYDSSYGEEENKHGGAITFSYKF